jgi:hypothetical protein
MPVKRFMAARRAPERLHGKRAIAYRAMLSRSAPARLAIAVVMLGCAALGARFVFAQDDDWSVVSHQVAPSQVREDHPAEAQPAAPQAPPSEPQPKAGGARMICGEMARSAAEPYKTIVANIEREWGADAPVYESVRDGSPHVSRGGCIFYNPAFMDTFLRGETDEHGEPDKTSMIYAIMAHELGHIEHHDYDRTQVSSLEKELEADRFSGYTLQRLGISRANITAYYSLGGDEFSGVHNHGFSDQRIAAFDSGWKRSEWNEPENGNTPKSVANDSSLDDAGAADDSSAAAVP